MLAERPIWLFQSGPIGEGAEDEQIATPRAIRKLATQRPDRWRVTIATGTGFASGREALPNTSSLRVVVDP